MIEAILSDKLGQLKSVLTEQAGFDLPQAEAFIPEAAKGFLGAFKAQGAGLDLTNIADSAASLLQTFDINSLAEKVGINAEQAQNGIAAILPMLLSLAEQHKDKLEMLAPLLGSLQNSSFGGMLSGFGSKLFGR